MRLCGWHFYRERRAQQKLVLCFKQHDAIDWTALFYIFRVFWININRRKEFLEISFGASFEAKFETGFLVGLAKIKNVMAICILGEISILFNLQIINSNLPLVAQLLKFHLLSKNKSIFQKSFMTSGIWFSAVYIVEIIVQNLQQLKPDLFCSTLFSRRVFWRRLVRAKASFGKKQEWRNGLLLRSLMVDALKEWGEDWFYGR